MSADRGTDIDDVRARREATEELEHVARNLEALIRAAPLGIVALDPETRVETWNRAAERILGWSEEEVVGRPYPAVPEDKRAELMHEIEQAMRGVSLTGIETERVRKDGRRVAVNISTAPLRGGDGEPRGVMAILEDITDRKRAEQAQQRLVSILEATPDMVGTADPEGRLLYMNRKGRELLGVAEEDLSGRHISEFHPPWAAELILRTAIPRAIRDGVWSGESALLDQAGRAIPVLQVILAHTRQDGELEYLSTIARDITDRKRAEGRQRFLARASRALSRSLKSEQILETVTGLIIPRLADFCLVDMVEDGGRIRRVAGAHRDPGMQDLVERLRELGQRADARDAAAVAGVLRTGEPELVHRVTDEWLRAATRDGKEYAILRRLRPTSVLIVPLTARGQVIGALTCAYAVTPRHHTDSDLELAQDVAGRAALALDNARLYGRAQQAIRIREEVLRVVAHDLRNPLNTIGMSAELLLETAPPEVLEQFRQPLAIIQRSAARANRLISDLLDVSRLEAGKLAVARVRLETGLLVREALELQRVAAEGKGLELEEVTEGSLPPVYGDHDRLLQVFGNILDNAIKFTPAGGRIEVEARVEPGAIRFSVSDNGPGIPPDERERVFEPFWQSGRRSVEGTGLGLGIAKGIIEAHGGRMWIESGPGAGTAVRFTVPTAAAEADAPPADR